MPCAENGQLSLVVQESEEKLLRKASEEEEMAM